MIVYSSHDGATIVSRIQLAGQVVRAKNGCATLASTVDGRGLEALCFKLFLDNIHERSAMVHLSIVEVRRLCLNFIPELLSELLMV